MQRDKACGPDSIPAYLLKVGADFICSPLFRIFQLSPDSGSLPRDWITANIVPVYKKDDKHLSSNYRPISLTSFVVKVMERIIHRQLTYALESHKLISESQHGFRNKHSTVTLLVSAFDDWSACLERRNSVHCLLLDLAKAFDSVPHQRLLLRLESLGIHGNLLSWLNSFLTKRYQRVVVNGSFSEWLPVRSGVPQGSVLGPLLFLLYVDELRKVSQHSIIKLFADDIALYKEIVSSNDCKLLQDDLTAIFEWCKKWLLKLNPLKCDSICISYKRVPPLCAYFLDGQQISLKSVVRYLGIFINSQLKWGDHMKHLVAKASRSLNYLRHTLFSCSASVKATAYRAVVRPILEYASPVWCLHTKKDVTNLEAIQRRAARWVCGSRWDTINHNWSRSSDSCLQELHWPTLHTRRSYFSTSLTHDILHNRVAIPFSKYFQFSITVTRSHPMSLFIPSSTINSRRFSFFINSPFLWNTIPHRILKLTNPVAFRTALRRFLFA